MVDLVQYPLDFLGKIKGSLLLNNQEFIDLVECPLTSDLFEAIVRNRIEK
jgi:hypothetical protein